MEIYASYALTYWSSILFPRFLSKLIIIDSSRKFTMAISNAPGPIKQFKIVNYKGEESFLKWVGNYGLGSGCVGLLVCGISNYQTFKISVTADEVVCP